jgi:hypothetical protein
MSITQPKYYYFAKKKKAAAVAGKKNNNVLITFYLFLELNRRIFMTITHIKSYKSFRLSQSKNERYKQETTEEKKINLRLSSMYTEEEDIFFLLMFCHLMNSENTL